MIRFPCIRHRWGTPAFTVEGHVLFDDKLMMAHQLSVSVHQNFEACSRCGRVRMEVRP